MATSRQTKTSLGVLAGVGLLLGVTGCDYWPPALQAQVEQLRSETQTLAIEKTQLQTQLSDLARAKQDLQTQIDDLSRMNREKTGMITSLHNQLDTLRAKAVKANAHKPATKPVAKATPKSAAKHPAKKKPATKKM
jgi:chromosome segregation ATPase